MLSRVMLVGSVLAVAIQITTSGASKPPASTTNFPSEMAALMDPSVSPCDDFFQYSCGGWIKATQLPEDSNYVSYATSKVEDANRETLVRMYQQGKPLVSELYQSCMNVDQLTASGSRLLEATRIRIASVTTKRELFRLAGEISVFGPTLLSGFGISPDPKNATRYLLGAGVADLTLEEPDMYTDPENWSQLEQPYRQYIVKLFTLFGAMNSTAQANANTVIQLEKQIAEMFVAVQKQEANQTQLSAAYHPTVFQDAAKKYPLTLGALAEGMNLLNRSSLRSTDTILLASPAASQAMEETATTTSLESLRTYLQFEYLDFASGFLGEPFLTARFEFYDKVINDQPKPLPRSKTCAAVVQTAFPDLVGKYFFDAKFSQESEQRAQSIVDLIEKTMQTRIENSKWLDKATRKAALKKLSLVSNLIGHSQTVEEFKGPLNSTTYFANMKAIALWSINRLFAKLGKPVDRNEWGMSGATVNAYYDASLNKMAFPAGILQPPFFNSSYLPVQNFGSIGAVMGHELTHGFDDNGRQFDGYGNLAPWWTNKTNARFEERAKCLADQYSSFKVISTTNSSKVIGSVDGNATLGENIADNGGFGLAFDAFHSFVKASKQKADMPMDDMERVFFVAYAQSWCSKGTDGMKKQSLSDSHAPDEFRVNGVVQNDEHFGKLFQCKTGTPMNPKSKCQVW